MTQVFFADGFNPNQPRDEDGRWTSEGSVGGFGSRAKGTIGFGIGDNPLPRSDLNVYAAAGKKRFSTKWDKAFKEETIPVETLWTRQTLLDKAEVNLEPVADPTQVPPIKVARINGKNIVLDGNHRAASFFLQGLPEIRANVIDLDDPKNAGLINRDRLNED